MRFRGWRWFVVAGLLVVGVVVAMTQAPSIVADKGKIGEQWTAEHVTRTKLRLATAARAIERYRADTGGLPETLEQVKLEVRTDPWGTDLIYERTVKDRYGLRSAGPDRVPNTADDIARNVDTASDAEFDALLRHVAPEQGSS